jgi:hypothetical protein
MNERIGQLAEQAGPNTQEELNSMDRTNVHVIDVKKFAELIIRECIEIVEPCKCGCCDGEPEGIITDTIIKQIKQHFGVEE